MFIIAFEIYPSNYCSYRIPILVAYGLVQANPTTIMHIYNYIMYECIQYIANMLIEGHYRLNKS